MNNVTVRKPRNKLVRIRLTPELQHALKGIRKLYCNDRTPTAELLEWTLTVALSHWSLELNRKIWAERKYMWVEDIHSPAEFYARKLEALWKK